MKRNLGINALKNHCIIKINVTVMTVLTLSHGAWSQTNQVVRVGNKDYSLSDISRNINLQTTSDEDKGRLFDALTTFVPSQRDPVLRSIIESHNDFLVDVALLRLADDSSIEYVKYIGDHVELANDQEKVNMIDDLYRRFDDPLFKMNEAHFAIVAQSMNQLSGKLLSPVPLDVEDKDDASFTLVEGCQILSIRKSPSDVSLINRFVTAFPEVRGLVAPSAPKWLALANINSVSQENRKIASSYLAKSDLGFIARICISAAVSQSNASARQTVIKEMQNFIKYPGYTGSENPLYGLESIPGKRTPFLVRPYFGEKFLAMSCLGVWNDSKSGELIRLALSSPSPFIRDKGLTLWAARYPNEFIAAYKAGKLKNFPPRRLDLLVLYLSQNNPDLANLLAKKWGAARLSNLKTILEVDGIPYRYCLLGAIGDE